jgi:hypothetical protein
MKTYGDIELIGSEIINLKVDAVDALPTFITGDESRLVYLKMTNTTNGVLYLNNGSDYVPLQIASEDNEPFLATLGANWINADHSFNPTPFNDLPGNFVTGLSGTDSLFSVISKLNAGLASLSDISVNSINEFDVNNPTAGDILYYNGEKFVNTPLSDIPDFGIHLALSDLTNVEVMGTPSDNDGLFFDHTANGGSGAYVVKKAHFVYENLTPNTTHVVSHQLGQQFCSVSVFRTDTNKLVTPSDVTFNSGSQLTVTLGSSLPVVIYVNTIPVQN